MECIFFKTLPTKFRLSIVKVTFIVAVPFIFLRVAKKIGYFYKYAKVANV